MSSKIQSPHLDQQPEFRPPGFKSIQLHNTTKVRENERGIETIGCRIAPLLKNPVDIRLRMIVSGLTSLVCSSVGFRGPFVPLAVIHPKTFEETDENHIC
jgi:hypothetical protein